MGRRKKTVKKSLSDEPVIKSAKTKKEKKVALKVKVTKGKHPKSSSKEVREKADSTNRISEKEKRQIVLNSLDPKKEGGLKSKLKFAKVLKGRKENKGRLKGDEFLTKDVTGDSSPINKKKSTDKKKKEPAKKPPDNRGKRTSTIPRESIQEEIMHEKVERNKRLIMWSGVTFFMVLIVFGWAYSTRQVFKNVEGNNEENFSLSDWREITTEISEKMSQIENDLKAIEEFNSINTSSSGRLPSGDLDEGLTDSLNTTTTETQVNAKEIEELKKKLQELQNDQSE